MEGACLARPFPGVCDQLEAGGRFPESSPFLNGEIVRKKKSVRRALEVLSPFPEIRSMNEEEGG